MASNTIAQQQITQLTRNIDAYCAKNKGALTSGQLDKIKNIIIPNMVHITSYFDLKDTQPELSFMDHIKEHASLKELQGKIAEPNTNDKTASEGSTKSSDEILGEVLHNHAKLVADMSQELNLDVHAGLDSLFASAEKTASEVQGVSSSARGVEAVRELKDVAPPAHLQELNKTLVDKGYKFLKVSGEGDHCGLRSVSIAMLNHYQHLDPAGRDQFLQKLDQSLDNAEDKAQLKAMFEAAGHSLENVVQTETNPQSEIPAVRVRLPNEDSGFKAEERGLNGGLETKAEALVSKLIVAFSQELAHANPADNEQVNARRSHEANDLADSVTSSRQMSSDIIPKLLEKLGISHAWVVDNNSHCWNSADQQLHSSQAQFKQMTENAITSGQSIIEHKGSHFNIYVQ